MNFYLEKELYSTVVNMNGGERGSHRGVHRGAMGAHYGSVNLWFSGQFMDVDFTSLSFSIIKILNILISFALSDNTYAMERDKPIAFDTVVTVNSTGHTINSWGKDLFFLPHMITVDSENNIWMTDVALHQIFKFAPYGGDHKPLLSLGTRFQPGSDDR